MSTQDTQGKVPAHGLAHPLLAAMAEKGFDVPCLQGIEQQAFAAAAQEMQNRHGKGLKTSAEELKSMVNRYLAGENPSAPSDRVAPSHIATYMLTKSRAQQAAPEQLLREAAALASLDFPDEAMEKECRPFTTQLLGSQIVALRQYAALCEEATPIFARTLRDRAKHIETHYKDKQNLKTVIAVISQVQSGQLDDNDESDDATRLH